MKKKGFTLVELLAVIAILAILVIVAMPNVLGMFNQAKVNSFVTEVQKIMDTATTTFTKDALTNSGQTVYYSSVDNATLETKKLDMSGNEKNYFIEMDRNGNFNRVVVYDSNYCYDIYASGTNGKLDGSKSKLIFNKIEKTSVVVSDIWESGNDSVGITMNGTNYVVSGCEGDITVEGKEENQVVSKMQIDGVEYNFIDGMKWIDWINTEYNTLNISLRYEYIYVDSKSLRTGYEGVCDFSTGVRSALVNIYQTDHIIKDYEYAFIEVGIFPVVGECTVGTEYYSELKLGAKKKVYTR